MQRTRQVLFGFDRWVASTAIVVSFGGCEVSTPIEDQIARTIEPTLDLGPPQRVFARRFVAPVWSAPAPEARRIGYLRAGALLHSTTARPHAHEGCQQGWYELDTGGFVCAGRDVTIFSGRRLPERRARQPDREAAMPYEFATVRRRTPVYRRIPRSDELVDVPPTSDSLEGDASSIDHPLVVRILEPGFYVSLDRTFQREGRTFWRTQQNGFVLAQDLRRRAWSEFRGVALDGRVSSLPVAVTRREDTVVYRLGDDGKVGDTGARVGRRELLPAHARRKIGEEVYWAVDQGRLLRESDVDLVEASLPPPEVADGERWIDVDLGHQTLVAYDWLRPLYVTLISSGRRRVPRPELDYLTPRGLFRIRAKHLTATMDSDEPGEPPYSLEDVPHVMYFKGAYAFHTAFWHDRFGRPRSHGCINMAPFDAKWLFDWAGPDMPGNWHGAYATDDNPGTWVVVRGETPGAGVGARR